MRSAKGRLRRSLTTGLHGVRAAAAGGALLAVCAASPVLGQTVENPLPEARPLSFRPTLSIADVGWDDNVFRVNESDNPVGDFTATFTPAAQLSLRLQHLRLTTQGEADFIYFKELVDIRSIDGNVQGRIDVPMGRLTPYLGGSWVNARHRRNFEIDSLVRRVDTTADAGVDVRLSGKTSVGVYTRRSKTDWEDNANYEGSDLSYYLDATAASNGVRARYIVTPLTTIGVDVERDRTEFPGASERNSTGSLVMPVVEFQPLALVSGRAQVGIRERTFDDGNVAPFRDFVARVDVAYTLLGRTRIGLAARRDLSYSYRADERDYLQTGFDVSVTQRVASRWALGGAFGRYRLIYAEGDPSAPSRTEEHVLLYSVNLGYELERTRVAFYVSRDQRSSDVSGDRDYEGMRIGSTVTFGF